MDVMLWHLLQWTAGLLLLALFVRVSRVIVFIDNGSIGVVEKLWSLRGSIKSGFIALEGSAGFQPEILRGGVHFFPPFQYRIHVRPLPAVPQGTIGYVFARSGSALPPGQALGSLPAGVGFEDARAFIGQGGQRGPQRQILREGVYPINIAQFVILTSEGTHAISLDDDHKAIEVMRACIEAREGFAPVVLRDREDLVGVVTVHDGPSLDHGQIIATSVGTNPADAARYHNCFQDPERFLAAGGRRGRQEQVLVEGTYYLNCLFATVERAPKTVVDIGKVGVVVSYTGRDGSDLTGSEYKHGELVEQGCRGVWERPLQSGKYAFNPHAIKVIMVPTTNFVLRWVAGSSEEHGYDSNLEEVRLITSDAFEPMLPLSIVVQIPYDAAPRVVQQFADLKLLVEQTLDPMVSAYFKDAAQKCTLLELVQQRAEIQKKAFAEMKERFARYHLNLMEVMIGTPRPAAGDQHMATILDQLRARQVATEQAITYDNQRKAAEAEREMREAEAAAKAQTGLTQSKIGIEIAENTGRANVAIATREADSVRVKAAGNAERIRVEGLADAARIEAVGRANAASVEAQVKAFGGPEFQLRKEIAQMLQLAIDGAKVPLVPTVVVGEHDGGSALQALLAMALGDKAVAARGTALTQQ
ncbi:MAG TPA: SPFH domain-containing protein [Nevskiaceae bacterium]|nr:SPFH domain-containing protein [Nevskiaceae bacterium]